MNGLFSDELERWLRSDESKTLRALGDVFEEKSFAATILLLMFLPALPVPTGGVTHCVPRVIGRRRRILRTAQTASRRGSVRHAGQRGSGKRDRWRRT